RNVVSALAFAALQYNVISRHKLFPISDCQFPISNFYVRPVTFVFPIGNRQLEIGNDAIRPPLKPCPRPPFAHLREWRTAILSPSQSARSTRCPSSHCRPASPSRLPAAGALPQSRPSSGNKTADDSR